ncbi:isoprenyl transferase [Thiomicrorhabdus sp. 6S3-12]|uniref:isoprenyl transferase n=1 Tax=Thiomicrorhabdus sp. 6S3-12 TaxID=2819681 RepID=UPI001AAD856F|nr:isoprenyl transferase [Thiomicrorhabdus sp. 6S3-12]MBO1924991.1 isoprenyl transferase [Thiomicrorhabdus sp. 6S3-12]
MQGVTLPDKLTETHVPQHIAIIMDGNGRWAKKRLLPRFIGHQKGLKAVKRTITHCAKRGVKALTLFAFSTENWRRPKDEVNKLMSMFLTALQKEVKKLDDNNVQLRIIGDRSGFSQEIQQHIEKAEALTRDNDGLVLNIAANYGGQWDIVEAVKAWQAANPDKSLQELTVDELGQYIANADLPLPDLLIRTGGEQRISNFLIWQMAYSELYFTDALWPDFGSEELDKAIDSFSSRERRFGRTSEQVQQC